VAANKTRAHRLLASLVTLALVLFVLVVLLTGTHRQFSPPSPPTSTPTPAVQIEASLDSTAAEALLAELTNQARTEASLPPLFSVDNLTALAEWRANDMATRHYFSHTIPPGDADFSTVMQVWGVPYTSTAENIGRVHQETTPTALRGLQGAFLASPDHREAILLPELTRLGVGVATSDDGYTYVAVIFDRETEDGAFTTPPTSPPAP
jgi:uncharacterized protein YkwD